MYGQGECEICGQFLAMIPIANPQPRDDGSVVWDVVGTTYPCGCGTGAREFVVETLPLATMPRLVREPVERA